MLVTLMLQHYAAKRDVWRARTPARHAARQAIRFHYVTLPPAVERDILYAVYDYYCHCLRCRY